MTKFIIFHTKKILNKFVLPPLLFLLIRFVEKKVDIDNNLNVYSKCGSKINSFTTNMPQYYVLLGHKASVCDTIKKEIHFIFFLL